MTQQELTAALEPLVDATSLSDVILALTLVCYEKAEHVTINWQDAKLAKIWEQNGKRLAKLSETGLP